ncbi:MAG: hypothetical protein OXR66_07550 [Candidatus Woesearchaeota archaeon]|nr:hypothetical protein [Candidatus Woesearchaeota archaeon]
MGRKEEEVIDTVIETLYALDVEGYKLINLDDKVLKSQALRRINNTIEKLHSGKRQLLSNAHYRLDLFEKFQHLTQKERDEIVELAKEKHISLEEAYMIASGPRSGAPEEA